MDIVNLPGNIQTSFVLAALEMLHTLDNNRLHVILVDAPEQRFTGHMIRVAAERNVEWYRDLCAAHERDTDKNGIRKALIRMTGLTLGREKTYDRLVFVAVEKYLVDIIGDEDVIKYINTGVPF